ncbi:MAG: hypothetical protein LBC40_00945 [Dysgonamonadaceae bacterium]|jgi:hypothetical protein|nr:hypothetical protein [Dysgonamonadaceae bacterium]
MTAKCVEKLLNAGYIFIRERDIEGKSGKKEYAVFQSTSFGAWSKLASFATKAARGRKMKELEDSDWYIV